MDPYPGAKTGSWAVGNPAPSRREESDRTSQQFRQIIPRLGAYKVSGFVVRQLIELSGISVSRIVVAGGGTVVWRWNQAIADATRRTGAGG
ncbi:hypothetical protein [Mycobacterium leprae]|uniref:hypothetical protein n=1 Tax=Mycobacterium leprae TaxID=1769 RepID=UPI0006743262|nr:hypothetical protein [Mycobacterium leprae]OAR20519.1 hypothetical protein A8144_02590 [Mycobacterium leprae 3125609]OAX70368.1 hypothetical protein A3216_12395 [Mycobacterium leprae 7935681]